MPGIGVEIEVTVLIRGHGLRVQNRNRFPAPAKSFVLDPEFSAAETVAVAGVIFEDPH